MNLYKVVGQTWAMTVAGVLTELRTPFADTYFVLAANEDEAFVKVDRDAVAIGNRFRLTKTTLVTEDVPDVVLMRSTQIHRRK